MKASRAFGILLVVLMGWHGIAFSQKWRALSNQPSFGANIPLLLTRSMKSAIPARASFRSRYSLRHTSSCFSVFMKLSAKALS